MKEERKYKRIRNQILRNLSRGDKSIWEVIVNQDTHLSEVLEIISKMLESGEISVENSKLKINKDYDFPFKNVRCEWCGGRGITIKEFSYAYEKYIEMVKNRPSPVDKYDQGYIAPEDVMRRVAYMYERGDVEGVRIMIIGDDDLCSLALASTEMPERITVMEIDERLVNYINKMAQKYGFNVDAHIFDARKDLPKEFEKSYDVFVTDPVETIPGIALFLSRAVSSLKEEGDSGYFGLTHQESSLKKWKKIEEMLLQMNFAITDMLRDFSVYPNEENIEISLNNYLIYRKIEKLLGRSVRPDVDFYRSTLIRVEAVDTPEPLVKGDVEITKEMYVDDESWVTALATKEV